MTIRFARLSPTILPCAAALALAGCAETGTPAGTPSVGLANPASQYCVSVGGTLEIRDEPDGQAGYCHLPDGQVVEEWTLFRQSQG